MEAVLVWYMVAFSVGLVTCTLSVLFSVKYHHTTLWHISLFYAANLIMMPRIGLMTLEALTGHVNPNTVTIAMDIAYALTIFLFSTQGPQMIRCVAGKPFTRTSARILTAAGATLGIASLIIDWALPPDTNTWNCIDILGIWLPTAYIVALGLLKIRQIPRELAGMPGRLCLIVAAIFFALNIPGWFGVSLWFDDFRLPVFFAAESALGLWLASRYFLAPFVESDMAGVTAKFAALYGLSARETEVINEVLRGFSSQEIGERLFISAKTVENHLGSIYHKTNTKNRYQLFSLSHGPIRQNAEID